MKRLKKYQSLVSYFSSSLATSGLGFAAALVMMRLMAPEEFGRFALFMSIQFIAVPMVSFNADRLIATNNAKLGKVEYEHFRRSYVTFAYLMFLVVQTIFILLYPIGILEDSLYLIIPICGLIRFLVGIASIEYVMEEKAVQYGVLAFSSAAVSLLFTVIFIYLFSAVADWRVAALVFSDLLFLCVRYRGRMKLLFVFSMDKQIFKDIMRFGFPLLLAVGPAWVLSQSDRLIVAQLVDIKAVGYYAAALAIGNVMIVFNTAMVQTITPRLYRELGESSGNMMLIVKRQAIKSLLVSVGFGGLFALMYGFTSDLFLPEKYAGARQIVFIYILFSLSRSFYSVLGLAADYYGMTFVRLRGNIYGCMTSVTVAFAGVIHFGVVGAAAGGGAGYLMLSWVLWISLVQKSREKLAPRKP